MSADAATCERELARATIGLMASDPGIRIRRLALGWKQAELARRSKVSPRTVWRIEQGEEVSLRTLDLVREALATAEAGDETSPAGRPRSDVPRSLSMAASGREVMRIEVVDRGDGVVELRAVLADSDAGAARLAETVARWDAARGERPAEGDDPPPVWRHIASVNDR